MTDINIINTVEIKNGKVIVNEKTLYQSESDFPVISKELYKEYLAPYIKFFKMDDLSKLGVICAEILLKDFDVENINKNEVALLMGNSNSTIATDLKYQETIKDQPSPAIFVYTLPNILMGEICIKYGFKGQNILYVSENYSQKELFENTQLLLNNSSAKFLISGWINFLNKDDYHAMFYLVKK